MARKSKNQPSPAAAPALPAEKVAALIETLAPARRGRKAAAAAPSPKLPSAAESGDVAANSVAADVQGADTIKAPGRKAVGRKQKPSAPAAVAALLQDAEERRGSKPHKVKAEATVTSVDDGAPGSETLALADDTASGDIAAPAAAPDLASEDAPALVKPAAHWDRATGATQFDWPAIEQVALNEGANQGMAKLLVAARAEGANSRWPL